MNIKQLKKWKKTRAKGKIRYILINGAIYGFSFVIFRMILREIRQPSNDFFGQFSLISLICYSIGGCIFSLWVWNCKEQDYLEDEYLLREDGLPKSEEKKEGQTSS